MNVLATFSTLDGLVTALTARRHALGLSQLALDDRAGLQSGYCGKIECGIKGLGQISLPLHLGGLRCELALVEAVRAPRTQGEESVAHFENYMSRKARKAALARWAKTTPKQRKKAARAAAKARWRKRQDP